MMQPGLVPPEGIPFPREPQRPGPWLGSHPTSALGCRASFSSDLHSLPEPQGLQLLAQTGSGIHPLQILGSNTPCSCRFFVL